MVPVQASSMSAKLLGQSSKKVVSLFREAENVLFFRDGPFGIHRLQKTQVLLGYFAAGTQSQSTQSSQDGRQEIQRVRIFVFALNLSCLQ